MWHDMHWYGWEGHMFSWWSIIVMGILILAVAFIIARSDSEEVPNVASGSDKPLDILERRYAQGEIDHDEFEQKRRDLES